MISLFANLVLIFIILEIVAHFFFPIQRFIFSPYKYIGILVIILGAIPNLMIHSLFKKAQTTIKPDEVPSALLTLGIFKISRNPVYLGMTLVLFGEAILLGSITCFVFPILFVIITDVWVIRMEEKNLEKKFSQEYLDYKKRVRRWI